MAVILLCPSCAHANEVSSLHHRACAECRSEFPIAMRERLAVALQVPRSPRPRLLAFSMVLAAFSTVVGAIVLPMALLTGGGTYTINGESVTREVFLAQAGPFFVVMFLSTGAVAWALWTERAWGRELIMACAAALSLVMIYGFASDPTTRTQWPAWAFASLLYVALPAWYLYGRRSVREYYAGLRARVSAAGTA